MKRTLIKYKKTDWIWRNFWVWDTIVWDKMESHLMNYILWKWDMGGFFSRARLSIYADLLSLAWIPRFNGSSSVVFTILAQKDIRVSRVIGKYTEQNSLSQRALRMGAARNVDRSEGTGRDVGRSRQERKKRRREERRAVPAGSREREKRKKEWDTREMRFR